MSAAGARVDGREQESNAQNTIALGAALQMLGADFKILEDILTRQFKKKGDAVVANNVTVARAGCDYATAAFPGVPVHPVRHRQTFCRA